VAIYRSAFLPIGLPTPNMKHILDEFILYSVKQLFINAGNERWG